MISIICTLYYVFTLFLGCEDENNNDNYAHNIDDWSYIPRVLRYLLPINAGTFPQKTVAFVDIAPRHMPGVNFDLFLNGWKRNRLWI